MSIMLPPLPYAKGALSPYISEETVAIHYENHHAVYVDKLNALIQGTELESFSSVEEILYRVTDQKTVLSLPEATKVKIFNNAAQIDNHNRYWQSLDPKGIADIEDASLVDLIERSFGSVKEMLVQLKQASIDLFGSGWTWLVFDSQTKKLKIEQTSNAHTPLVSKSKRILITIDVWEHAYYVQYRNRRPEYVETLLKLIDWKYAAQNLKHALS